MKKLIFPFIMFAAFNTLAQQPLFMPQNVKKAYDNETRSADGKPGKNYWQNTAHYNINVAVTPPSKAVEGSETIIYTNKSPKPITNIVVKLILNIHKPGAVRQSPVGVDYLTNGIIIDQYQENGIDAKIRDANANTWITIALHKPVPSGDSVQLNFKWHFTLSEESNREGKLDSTSFFLAYFYPRIAVLDDVNGWDRMNFTDAQEFYNDFNNYKVLVTVPKNFLVWGTGNLLNPAEVLQPAYLSKFNKSFTSDEVINIVTKQNLDAKNITTQNATNTWAWQADNVSDMAFCISDHYVWDAASVVVDKASGRRASCQSAFLNEATNFHNQVKHIQHSLDWYSNNWPGVAYPFAKSTIIEGFADMEYPMMANDSRQNDDVMQRFIAEHEVGHSYFPFYMGINEHRYGFMDEGWTTAFENLIAQVDLGKEKANAFFKQFRVAGWAVNPSEETQIPIITPGNILSGQAMGHNEYGKPALAYLGLKDLLGDALFKKSLHGFMDRWHGKHPIPWDMFNSFSNLSGKDLSWYFNSWFFSNSYMDIAIDNFINSKNDYTLTVKNIGGFVIPFDIIVNYADSTVDTLHQTPAVWEANQQLATIKLSNKKKVTSLKLDVGLYMDANEKNNTWGTPTALSASTINLNKYTGIYASTTVPLKIIITAEGSTLWAQATGQDKFSLNDSEKDTFSAPMAGIILEFNVEKGEMVLKQGGGVYIFTKEK